MNVKDSIRSTLNLGLFLLDRYTSDFTDADLLRRPAPGCNHIAWQIGHLINSEVSLLNMLAPGSVPELPAGFAAAHAKENNSSDDPAQFFSRQAYLDLYQKVRAATLAALDKLPEEKLAEPAPDSFRKVFPTMLDMFTLIGVHPATHAGQFIIVRRQLGKPILI